MSMENEIFGFIEKIKNSGDKILEISHKTESDFVLIGNKLFEINSFSKKINTYSSKVSEVFSSGRIESILNSITNDDSKIGELLIDSSIYFKKFDSAINSIKALLEKSKINLDSFDKVRLKLNMISVLIRIESGRLGVYGRDFLTLAESVNRLSDIIIQIILDVTIEINDTFDEVLEAGIMVENILHNMELSKDKIHNKIVGSTEYFKSENYHKNKLIDEINDNVKHVFSNIGKVITLCQVQDGTKQQLEHIAESFPKLQDEINTIIQTEDCGLACVLLKKTLQIENDQLGAAKNNFVGSTLEILKLIQGIALKSGELIDITQNVISSKKGESHYNLLESIICEMTPLTNKLAGNILDSQKILELIFKVMHKVENITNFINDINILSYEIDLLAINSIIKALKLGKRGSGLAILSMEIQELSVLSHNESENLTKLLASIALNAKILEAQDENLKQKENFDAIVEVLNLISNRLENLDEENKNISLNANNLFDEINSLENNINNLIPRITIQDYFNNEITNLENKFDSIINSLKDKDIKNDYSQALIDNEFFKNMTKKYTMDSERRIYKSHINNEQIKINSGENEIEYFDSIDTTAVSNSDLGDAELFDDNIELF